MATTVFTTKKIKLLDGTEVELRPLEIKRKRQFMEVLDRYRGVSQEFSDKAQKWEATKKGEAPNMGEFELVTLDLMVEMSAVCLSKQLPELTKEDDGRYPDLEDVLDEETIYEVIQVCGGVNLNPKAASDALAELMATETETGGVN